MTSEVKLSDQKRKIITKVDADKTSKRYRKKRCCRETSMTMIRSPPPAMFPLQRLYMSCLDAFKGVGTVPSPSDDQKLRHILDGLTLEDILLRNLQVFDPSSTVVEYIPIYHCNNFSLFAFFLPENAVIPLHSHPGMTVFNKLLYGTMHIKAYDLVNPTDTDTDTDNNNSTLSSQLKLACLKTDDIFTAPCDTSVLYPTSGGNIHAFTAITRCVFLDVVGPPYSKKDGRDCSYYKEYKDEQMMVMHQEEDGKRYRWLEEIEMPKEAIMDGIEYLGPHVIEVN